MELFSGIGQVARSFSTWDHYRAYAILGAKEVQGLLLRIGHLVESRARAAPQRDLTSIYVCHTVVILYSIGSNNMVWVRFPYIHSSSGLYFGPRINVDVMLRKPLVNPLYIMHCARDPANAS